MLFLHLRQILCLRSSSTSRYIRNSRRFFTVHTKRFANKTPDDNEENNNPIKYSKSPAIAWQAQYSRIGSKNTRLWYEPYVVLLSISVFLTYFCVFREENDIDVELGSTLYSRISGLEEHQLHFLIDYNREKGLETKEIQDRLNEIEAAKRGKETKNTDM